MNTGPWYECIGPERDEVFSELISIYPNKKKCINNILDKFLKKYESFGSYRGYACFFKSDLIKSINDQIENDKKKIVNRFIMNYVIWPKYIHNLYKPGGKCYNIAKNDFEAKKV